jgi:ATP-binding cassette, sub-family E, member 1
LGREGKLGADRWTDYFTKLLEDDLKAVVKPQYVDQIPKAIRAADKSVKALIESRLSMDNLDEVVDTLGELTPLFGRCLS